MKDDFKPSLAAVLVHEGGKDDDKRDPGGRTAYGVTQSRYNQFRRDENLPRRDVWLITPDEREKIYKRYYWDVIQADKLPAGLDYVVFDGAVNSGPAQATKWLQRALGIAADGLLGPDTLKRAQAVNDLDALIAKIQDQRLAFLKALRTWKTFGRGWGRRVEEVRKIGFALAAGSVDIPMPTSSASGKAYASSAKAPPPKAIGDMLAGGGIVSTTISTATDAVTPLADKSDMAATVLTVLMVAGAIVVVVGVVYRIWAKARAEELADALDLKAPVFVEGPDLAPEPEDALA